MWVAPSVACLVGCLAVIVNVKGGYIDYDPTHNQLFKDTTQGRKLDLMA